ncbi:MAG: aminotransferase class V-fold PLP-dependent enzyme [Proteobacteria bacterium]|nr:aminotransferase class V-fold PLP-dependent enzyme [Pseudomonadota bacterium]
METVDDRWGAAARDEWTLDPVFVSVNHGSYGATPRVVLAAQAAWRDRIEAQPARFMRAELPGALRAAAARLADFLGTAGEDVVFIANATEGCNAVLRAFDLAPGDEILVLDHGYGAVRNTVRHVAAGAGARVIEAAVPFPRPEPAALVAAVTAALTPRTRLAVLDHITSPSAIVLPLAEIIAACRATGVAVLVDGAHAPGQVALDLPALGADWYVGNCHKWLCAPKGTGFLWAAPARQAGLHPAVISHGYDQGFVAEFDWTGTRDPSAFLAVPAALDFCARLGGPALVARNRALAAAAGAWLAERLGTEVGTAGVAAGSMASMRLPLAGQLTQARAAALADALLAAGTDAPPHRIGEAAWLRVSAHAYNTMDDYARLADILARVLPAA